MTSDCTVDSKQTSKRNSRFKKEKRESRSLPPEGVHHEYMDEKYITVMWNIYLTDRCGICVPWLKHAKRTAWKDYRNDVDQRPRGDEPADDEMRVARY